MDAAKVLRRARRRAGLTQRELAQRSGVAQPTIARIERGVEEPRVGTLDRMLHECGERLASQRRGGIGIDRTLIQDLLAMTPAERLVRTTQAGRALAVLSGAKQVGDGRRRIR